jgi:GH25 family lysozyme M1 (1,4-beta-N-acetylmuramidase)
MLAASNLEAFFKSLPDILKAAAASPLGIAALAISGASVVLIFLGKGLPTFARSLILVLVLVGVSSLTWRVISLSQFLPNQPGTIEPGAKDVSKNEPQTVHSDASTILQSLNGGSKRYLVGVDVSDFDNVNWSRVAETPIGFVFVRATQGLTKRDMKLAANWRAAGEAHLQRGAYHFFRADQDGADQAVYFLKALSDAGATDAELPAALDLEEVPRTLSTPVDNFTFVKRVQAWLAAVETATKRKPIIYTTKPFWDAHGSNDFSQYPLWVPRYKLVPPTTAQLPRGWKRWTFWQFGYETDFGAFGKLDANVFDPMALLAPNQ